MNLSRATEMAQNAAKRYGENNARVYAMDEPGKFGVRMYDGKRGKVYEVEQPGQSRKVV